jgi:serine/threonine protein kinase
MLHVVTPERFGSYWLVEHIGEGGMGAVYIARRDGIDDVVGSERLCVIKTMLAGSENTPGAVARFVDEARLVTRLSHKNICPVLDVGRVDGRPYVAMDIVAGVDAGTLFNHLEDQKRTMPVNVALYIINETLEALDYAHRLTDPLTGERLGVVHRDVSPHNVMVTFEGEVKLIDFGIAKSSLQREITEKDLVLGKLKYMAPEQARGQPVDGRSDIYSVGVMLYELLTGHRFFEGHGDEELFQLLPKGGFLPAGIGALPASLRVIVERALESDADKRYATCADMLAALDALPERRDPGAGRALARLLDEELAAEKQRIRARLAHASALQPLAVLIDDSTTVVPEVPAVTPVANAEDFHTQPTAILDVIEPDEPPAFAATAVVSITDTVVQNAPAPPASRAWLAVGASVVAGVIVAIVVVVKLVVPALLFSSEPDAQPAQPVAIVAPVVEVIAPVEDAGTIEDAVEDAGVVEPAAKHHARGFPTPPKAGHLKEVLAYLRDNCRERARCATPLLKKRGLVPRMAPDDIADFVHDADACARACSRSGLDGTTDQN